MGRQGTLMLGACSGMFNSAGNILKSRFLETRLGKQPLGYLVPAKVRLDLRASCSPLLAEVSRSVCNKCEREIFARTVGDGACVNVCTALLKLATLAPDSSSLNFHRMLQ